MVEKIWFRFRQFPAIGQAVLWLIAWPLLTALFFWRWPGAGLPGKVAAISILIAFPIVAGVSGDRISTRPVVAESSPSSTQTSGETSSPAVSPTEVTPSPVNLAGGAGDSSPGANSSPPPGAAGTAPGALTITFLAVGQGDSALYRGPCGELGLIDANNGAADEVLAALDAASSRNLAWISPSHYDFDHIGDILDVARSPQVTVGAVYDRGGDRTVKDTNAYREYFDWVTGAGIRHPVDIGNQFSLCTGDQEVTFSVVSAGTDGTAAGDAPVSEENDRGVCLKVTFRRFDLVTCGDVNGTDEGSRTDVESAVAGSFGDIEVAKVNHHGSRFSSNGGYVSALRAQVSVISVGKNSYGHPDPGVIARWDQEGDVFQTQASDGSIRDGNISVSADGLNNFMVVMAKESAKTYLLD